MTIQLNSMNLYIMIIIMLNKLLYKWIKNIKLKIYNNTKILKFIINATNMLIP